MSRNAIVSVLGALGLAAIAPHVTPHRDAETSQDNQSRGSATHAASDTSKRRRSARELVAEYDGAADFAEVARKRRGTLTVIIATLPDPIDSHMDWAFDSGIESIRRANEATGFVMDRFWLPWPGTGDSARVKPNGATRPVRDVYPGVLLFRPTSPTDSALRVFLIVGETSAYGLRASQFDAALAERDTLLGSPVPTVKAKCRDNQWTTSRVADPAILRIVGPVSSGSSASLRRALDRWRLRRKIPGCSCVAEIVSGGATNAGNREWFVRPSYSFHATVHSDDYLQSAIEHYLDAMGIGQNEIAYLREGSSYGQGAALRDTTRYGTLTRLRSRVERLFTDGVPAIRRHEVIDSLLTALDTVRANDTLFHSVIHSYRRRQPTAEELLARRDSILRIKLAGLTQRDRDSMPISIRFPVNISRLRSEYARHPAAPVTQTGAPQAPRIPLNLVDAPVTDEAPYVASDFTAPSLEFIIAEVAGALRTHHIKAVGILASDVRDKLFLADELKHRLRDVQLFTFGSNVLLAREDFGSLRGMLVVSSYPLTLENQHWDLTARTGRERIPFQSDIAEGIFNATLFQLDQGSLAADYSLPLSAVHTATPPVWISAVGKRTILPIEFENAGLARPADSASYLEASQGPISGARGDTIPLRSTSLSAQPSELVTYGFFTLALVLAFFATYGVAQYRINARARVSLDTLAGIATEDLDPDARSTVVMRHALMFRREVYALIRLGAILLLFFAVALFTMRSKAHGQLFDAWRYLLPTLFVIAAAFAMARAARPMALLARYGTLPWATHGTHVRRDRPLDGIAWFTGIVARALLLVIAIIWFGAFVGLISDIDVLLHHAPGHAALFFLRTTAIGSGLSPAWPLLLGGLGLMSWSAWHLRRVGLLGRVTAIEYFSMHSKLRAAVDRAFAPRATEPRSPIQATGVLARTSALLDEWHIDRVDRDSPAADVRSVRRHLFYAVPGVRGAALLAYLLCFAIYQWSGFHRSFESDLFPSIGWPPFLTRLDPSLRWPSFLALTHYDVLYRTIILSAIVSIAWALYRLLATWFNLRDFLRAIGYTPLLDAFGRSSKGIEFDALDNAPVRFVVLFVVPKDQFQTHLRTLAAIAKFLNDRSVRDRLGTAADADEILQIFESSGK